MANVRSGNSYFIDATGNLSHPNIKVVYVVYRATNATNNVIIKDVTTGATKLDLSAVNANETFMLDFSECPLLFPNGIDVTTATACKVTLIGRESTN